MCLPFNIDIKNTNKMKEAIFSNILLSSEILLLLLKWLFPTIFYSIDVGVLRSVV